MRRAACSAVMALVLSFGALGPASAQSAGDFFAAIFGGLARPRAPQPMAMFPGLAPDAAEAPRTPSRTVAYCVRMCDGRYFPLTNAADAQSQCASFCPKAETQVFRGSGTNIEDATNDAGRSYSAIPNAYVYRTKLDNACTCTGQGPTGLAPVPVKEDATLRRGDIVMTAEGARVFDAKSSSPPHKDSAFVPPGQASRLSRDTRQQIEDLKLASDTPQTLAKTR